MSAGVNVTFCQNLLAFDKHGSASNHYRRPSASTVTVTATTAIAFGI